jgi:hypothetical protein
LGGTTQTYSVMIEASNVAAAAAAVMKPKKLFAQKSLSGPPDFFEAFDKSECAAAMILDAVDAVPPEQQQTSKASAAVASAR